MQRPHVVGFVSDAKFEVLATMGEQPGFWQLQIVPPGDLAVQAEAIGEHQDPRRFAAFTPDLLFAGVEILSMVHAITSW